MSSDIPRGHHFGLSFSGKRADPDLHDDILAISPDVRHVAVGSGRQVTARSRPGVPGADSDRYEELLVNPTLITLAGQRGDIDRGGLRYLVVGYGHFDQLVIPLVTGHLSIAFESDRDPARHLPALAQILARHGLFLREVSAPLTAAARPEEILDKAAGNARPRRGAIDEGVDRGIGAEHG